MQLIRTIEEHARKKPQSPALGDGARTLTYAELSGAIRRAAERLKQSQCSRLAIAGDNSIEWIISDLAALSLSLPVIPLPPFFTKEQRQSVLQSSGTTHITSGGDLMQTHASDLPALPAGTDKITYTSGSTGTPKGVCLPQAGLETVAASILDVLGAETSGRHLCLLPLGVLLENVAGVYTALLAGAEVCVPPLASIGFGEAFRPDFSALLNALIEHKATSVIMVPEILRGLLVEMQRSGLRPEKLCFAAVGGAKVAPALLEQAGKAGLPVYEGYGLSECGSVVSLNTPHQMHTGSSGRLLPHVRAHVREGEIVIERACFLGYLGETERKNFSFATGDIGQIDSEGFVTLQGRRKNLIITGFGRNVSPEWVESILLAQPQILQAVVYGDGESALKALVVPATPKADLPAAIAAANRQLPAYAHIGSIRIVPPLRAENGFLTGNGRIRRNIVINHFCHGESHEVL